MATIGPDRIGNLAASQHPEATTTARAPLHTTHTHTDKELGAPTHTGACPLSIPHLKFSDDVSRIESPRTRGVYAVQARRDVGPCRCVASPPCPRPLVPSSCLPLLLSCMRARAWGPPGSPYPSRPALALAP